MAYLAARMKQQVIVASMPRGIGSVNGVMALLYLFDINDVDN